MKRLMMVLAFGLTLVAAAAETAVATTANTGKMSATTADVDYAMKTINSAIRQYNALSDEQKNKVDLQAAKLAKVEDTAKFSAALREFCTTASTQSVMTVAMRKTVQSTLDANPKWCGAIKAARMTSQAMSKMGLQGGDLSLQDIVRLLPDGEISVSDGAAAK